MWPNLKKDKGAFMKGGQLNQGKVVVDGFVFDWCQDSADTLEVWQWQCGRRSSRFTHDTPEATAQALARELIAEFDERLAGTLNRRRSGTA